MPDDLWDALTEHAAAKGATASDVIRQLVADYTDQPLRPGMSVKRLTVVALMVAVGVPDERLDEVFEALRRKPLPETFGETAALVRETYADLV